MSRRKKNGKSVYRMKGSDKEIHRTKGGPSKGMIKNSPKFERTRQNFTEFSGCAKAARSIRSVLFPVHHLADYNFTPTLNALCKRIQVMDPHNIRGQRGIFFSQHRYLLGGFNLNKTHSFDSVVKHPLNGSINRSTGTAVVQIPPLSPGISLMIPWQYPLYRFVVILGAIEDRTYSSAGYETRDGMSFPHAHFVRTPWQHVRQPFAAQNVELQLPQPELLDDAKTMLLSVGIEIGMPVTDAYIETVKSAGCAKILIAA